MNKFYPVSNPMQVDTERMSRESKLSKEEDTELLSTTLRIIVLS
jgi:hypothetical protein